MRRLFLRIFVSVLLAVLVAFAVGIVVAQLVLPPRPGGGPRGADRVERAPGQPGEPPGPGGPEPREGRGPPAPPDVRAAEDVLLKLLAAGDTRAACERVEQLAQHLRTRAFLINPDGASPCGSTPESPIVGLAHDATAHGEVRMSEGGGMFRVAHPLAVEGRGTYALVVEFRPPGWLRYAATVYQAMQLVVVTIALGIVCLFLARYIAGPVLKLRTAVRRFADGDLEQRIGPSFGRRRDELAELGRDFDLMAERIAKLLSTQRRLLQDISHELRSPLTRQAVALELARRHMPPEGLEALDRAGREAGRINELVGELLTLTRLEAGAQPVERTTFALDELVRQVIDDVSYEARGTERVVRCAECAACAVDGVPELLRRAVENVLRNAVRYTPAGSGVDVALRVVGETAVLTVRDCGPGVPESALTEIFRPFYRVSAGRERESGGVGLGLAIAQRAAQYHGGTIGAQNAPDGGLIVELRVPVAAESPTR